MSEKTDCAANGGYQWLAEWLSSLYSGLLYRAHDSAGPVRHVDISYFLIVTFLEYCELLHRTGCVVY